MAAAKPVKANALANDPQIAAGIVPIIAEINAANRRAYKVLADEQGPDLGAAKGQIETALGKVGDVWKLLLGKDLTALQLSPECLEEIQTVIQRHMAPA